MKRIILILFLSSVSYSQTLWKLVNTNIIPYNNTHRLRIELGGQWRYDGDPATAGIKIDDVEDTLYLNGYAKFGSSALFNGLLSNGNITTVDDTIHVGNASNYVSLDSANGLLMKGNATVWDDLQVPLITGRQGALIKPDFDYDTLAYMFPQNDTTEVLYITAQLPHAWKTGSTVYPHLHVQQSMNAQATFKIVYKWMNLGEAIPSTWLDYTMGTYANSYTSGRMQQMLVGSGGISGSGKTASSILIMKLYRSDNVYSGDMAAFTFDLHIERDKLGDKDNN